MSGESECDRNNCDRCECDQTKCDQIVCEPSFVEGIRRSFDNRFKLMVIEEAENTNNSAAARKFGVGEKNVRSWRKQKAALSAAPSSRKSFRGPKVGRFEEIDNQIVAFIRQSKEKGCYITREVIMIRGREIAQELGIQNFEGSLGWCRRMMKRHGIALRH